MLDYFSTAPERSRIGASRPQTEPDPEGTLSRYMAIITPSRHMETLMLAIVRNVRRRLRQQFLRTRGRNRSMRVLPVYEFPGPRDPAFGARPPPPHQGSRRRGAPPTGAVFAAPAARGLRATMEESHDFRPSHPLYRTPG